jgi:hypothetical protein
MAHAQHAAGIQLISLQTQAGLRSSLTRVSVCPSCALGGGEHRRGIQPLTMAFNARRAKQTVAQLGHQGDRRIDIQAAVGDRARRLSASCGEKWLKCGPQ